MSEVIGVVVGHGGVAEGLVRAAEQITGVSGALEPLSNDGLGAEALRDRLREICSPGPAVIFVDMAAGSCAMASLGLNRTAHQVGVITGASLPMLVDFVFHRDMDVDELVDRIVEKGEAGITGHRCRPGEDAAADDSTAVG